MAELARSLGQGGVCWKKNGPYNYKCRGVVLGEQGKHELSSTCTVSFVRSASHAALCVRDLSTCHVTDWVALVSQARRPTTTPTLRRRP